MRIGGSLLLIAIGAILRWAITVRVNGINLDAIGVILMVVGVVGFVLSLILLATRRRTEIVRRDIRADAAPVESRTTYMTPTRLDDEV